MTRVISGFPGVGKTHFKQNTTLNVLDSDSSNFSWQEEGVRHSNFPQNYIDHIRENLDRVDVILVSSHAVVRDALVENSIGFTLMFPGRDLREEYIKRFKERGSAQGFVEMISENWDFFMDEMEDQGGCEVVRLKSGEFLSHAMSSLLGQVVA